MAVEKEESVRQASAPQDRRPGLAALGTVLLGLAGIFGVVAPIGMFMDRKDLNAEGHSVALAILGVVLFAVVLAVAGALLRGRYGNPQRPPSYRGWAVFAGVVVVLAIFQVVGGGQRSAESQMATTPGSSATPAPEPTSQPSAEKSPSVPSTTEHRESPPATTSKRRGASPTNLESGSRMCKLGSAPSDTLYLYLVSKVDLDFSACDNAPTVYQDGYSIFDAYPDVDRRCIIDPGPLLGRAIGAVYSAPAASKSAYEFCELMGGYDFN
ncbi:hypothetical protein MUG78_17890 [Gordonia alkaliphila]|uniref:hypothetical protein n=1 Tax=Gordonia alkaliphila TaxID=1053547 RepID=UPI001FF1682A|nr:hypothetical protein [Gordonia alkaliphila]MCK0441274.1 hypothetical protein [Gordonia alkaliphila]